MQDDGGGHSVILFRLQALQHRNLWSNHACLTDYHAQMVSMAAQQQPG